MLGGYTFGGGYFGQGEIPSGDIHGSLDVTLGELTLSATGTSGAPRAAVGGGGGLGGHGPVSLKFLERFTRKSVGTLSVTLGELTLVATGTVRVAGQTAAGL